MTDRPTSIGGFVILYEEIDIDYGEKYQNDAIDERLLEIKHAKMVEGPFINGVWAITFEVDDRKELLRQIETARQKVEKVFGRYQNATSNPNPHL